MNEIAIAFLTRDRVELSRQSVEPLLGSPRVDLWWIDGSETREGQALPNKYNFRNMRGNVRGGPDAAVCYALTEMLSHRYDYVGVVENDVLLSPGWFALTFSLFERARAHGFEAGMVSARCYEDRVLAQVDDTFALMHNLGYGTFIATRRAAQFWLRHFRTCQAIENRRMFVQLSGVDIASFWAFGAQPTGLVSDWHVGTVLAAHGLACLALTPSLATMIGQDPPLAEQGLVLAAGPVEERRDPVAVARFAERSALIRSGEWRPGGAPLYQHNEDGTEVIFAHQLAGLGARWEGEWRLARGAGPFAWRSANAHIRESASLDVELAGPVVFLLSGPGRACLQQPGYETTPDLPAEGMSSVLMPAGVSHRSVTLAALDPGVTVHGIVVREPQPSVPFSFDWNALPPAGQ